MNRDLLLQHFDRISEAPDAVARLRQFILDLAVRGKLVEQDPADEPASELLKRIQARRNEMIKTGVLRAEKRIPIIEPKGILFSVPVSWAWTHANELWVFENGDRGKNYPSRDQLVSEGIPFVNAGHLVGGRVSMEEMNFISPEKFVLLGGGKLEGVI